jgi:hypothetical protein
MGYDRRLREFALGFQDAHSPDSGYVRAFLKALGSECSAGPHPASWHSSTVDAPNAKAARPVHPDARSGGFIGKDRIPGIPSGSAEGRFITSSLQTHSKSFRILMIAS